jgi:uncharacterized protein (TIGR02217 family)
LSLPVFPDFKTMAWDSSKIQRWDVAVQKTGSGRRKTLSRWSYPEWVLECSYTCLDENEIKQAAGFFAKVHSLGTPFLWKDLEDYHEEKTLIGTGDGSTKQYQLIKNYGGHFVEPVRDIVTGTLKVYVDDEPTSVTEDEGVITFATAPAVGAQIKASFDYYWRVTFEDTELEMENFWYGFYRLNTVRLVTVK